MSDVNAPASSGDSGAPPFDIAVIMPTLLRPTLLAAVRSVFAQDFEGRVQILLGIDQPEGDRRVVERIRRECPPSMSVLVCDPGYASRSLRIGKLPPGRCGGLRTALSWFTEARYLAYLDDDNWWGPDHLSSLRKAIGRTGFAYSLRWMVRTSNDTPAMIDRILSTGPAEDPWRAASRGLIDTNCLMIDRLSVPDSLWRWSHVGMQDGSGVDRQVTQALARKARGVGTGKATAFYRVDPAREAGLLDMTGRGPSERRPPPRIDLATLRASLAIAPGAPPSRGSVAPPPTDHPYRLLMRQRRPKGIVDLYAGEGRHSLCLAAAAAAESLAPSILAIDTWLPQPNDNKERGPFAMHRHGVGFARLQDELTKTGADQLVWTLPGCPLEFATLLRRLGLRIDVVVLSALRHDAVRLLEAWWPLLLAGGGAMVDVQDGFHQATGSALRAFGEFLGAQRFTLQSEGSKFVVLTKPAPVARRQAGTSA